MTATKLHRRRRLSHTSAAVTSAASPSEGGTDLLRMTNNNNTNTNVSFPAERKSAPISAGHARQRQPSRKHVLALSSSSSNSTESITSSSVVLVPDVNDNHGNIFRNKSTSESCSGSGSSSSSSSLTKKRSSNTVPRPHLEGRGKRSHHELTQSFTISPSPNNNLDSRSSSPASSSTSSVSHPISPHNFQAPAAGTAASWLYHPHGIPVGPNGGLPWMPSPLPSSSSEATAGVSYATYFPPLDAAESSSPPPRMLISILKRRQLRYTKRNHRKEKYSYNHNHSPTDRQHPPHSAAWCCPFPSLSSSSKNKNDALASPPRSSGGNAAIRSVFRLEPSSSISAGQPSPASLTRSSTTRFEIPVLEKATRIHADDAVPTLQEDQKKTIPEPPPVVSATTTSNTVPAVAAAPTSHTITPRPNDEYKMWQGYGGIPYSSCGPHEQPPPPPVLPPPKEVRFYPNVYKKMIPSRQSYSREDKHTLWTSPEDIARSSQRNIVEFSYDQWNWRTATEEAAMYYNTRTGRHDIHPALAHALYHKKQQQHKKRKLQQATVSVPAAMAPSDATTTPGSTSSTEQ